MLGRWPRGGGPEPNVPLRPLLRQECDSGRVNSDVRGMQNPMAHRTAFRRTEGRCDVSMHRPSPFPTASAPTTPTLASPAAR